MNWKSFRASAFALPLLLVMTCLLAGCLQTFQTPTAVTDVSIAAGVCMAWNPVTYSSRDTPETQLQARANNAGRAAYCPK